MKIVIATNNKDKFREIIYIFSPENIGVDLVFGGTYGFDPPEESGRTFFENARIKAEFFCKNTSLPSLADDSGLEVEFLNGAPGIFSSRYAGPGCSYSDNNRKLLAQLKDVPDSQRKARFVCVAVLVLPDGRVFSAEGTVEGKVTMTPRGVGGFGYDPIFELPDGRTMAELSTDEKNRISHRSKAFSKMREIIKHLIDEPDNQQ